MKTLNRIIAGIASLSFMFTVVQFEALTGLSSRWENPENRKLLEERMKLSHTNLTTLEYSETGYQANRTAVQNYSDQYHCMSKTDTSRCHGAIDANLQQ